MDPNIGYLPAINAAQFADSRARRNHEVGRTSLFGTFASPHLALQGVESLFERGITSGQVSILLPAGFRADPAGGDCRYARVLRGTVGGQWGIVVGVGAADVPEFAPRNAVGTLIAGVLTDTGPQARESLVQILVSMGVSPRRAAGYERHVRQGGVLIHVRCGPKRKLTRVREIVRQSGAKNLAVSFLDG